MTSNPIQLKEMHIQGGVLRSIEPEGNGLVLADLGGTRILLPAAENNLRDLIGQKIELGCIFGQIRIRLVDGEGERGKGRRG
jgi:hypothetical protein